MDHNITVQAAEVSQGFDVHINSTVLRGVHDVQFKQHKDAGRKIQLIVYAPVFVRGTNVPRIVKKTFLWRGFLFCL